MMRVEDFPEDPYPGRRPDRAWQLSAHGVLRPWLGQEWMPGRLPLLCYGSLACPGVVRHMQQRGLEGTIFMAAVNLIGAAAVRCRGERSRGGRPATLVVHPGSEQHGLWWATEEQVAVLDRREGYVAAGSRENYYERVAMAEWAPEAVVETLEGQRVEGIVTYVGRNAQRQPYRDEEGRFALLREEA